ncbi:UNVERIFIED_CONTAM: hypothetical protein NCL1_01150 [Trichonephila clavipes]
MRAGSVPAGRAVVAVAEAGQGLRDAAAAIEAEVALAQQAVDHHQPGIPGEAAGEQQRQRLADRHDAGVGDFAILIGGREMRWQPDVVDGHQLILQAFADAAADVQPGGWRRHPAEVQTGFLPGLAGQAFGEVLAGRQAAADQVVEAAGVDELVVAAFGDPQQHAVRAAYPAVQVHRRCAQAEGAEGGALHDQEGPAGVVELHVLAAPVLQQAGITQLQRQRLHEAAACVDTVRCAVAAGLQVQAGECFRTGSGCAAAVAGTQPAEGIGDGFAHPARGVAVDVQAQLVDGSEAGFAVQEVDDPVGQRVRHGDSRRGAGGRRGKAHSVAKAGASRWSGLAYWRHLEAGWTGYARCWCGNDGDGRAGWRGTAARAGGREHAGRRGLLRASAPGRRRFGGDGDPASARAHADRRRRGRCRRAAGALGDPRRCRAARRRPGALRRHRDHRHRSSRPRLAGAGRHRLVVGAGLQRPRRRRVGAGHGAAACGGRGRRAGRPHAGHRRPRPCRPRGGAAGAHRRSARAGLRPFPGIDGSARGSRRGPAAGAGRAAGGGRHRQRACAADPGRGASHLSSLRCGHAGPPSTRGLAGQRRARRGDRQPGAAGLPVIAGAGPSGGHARCLGGRAAA